MKRVVYCLGDFFQEILMRQVWRPYVVPEACRSKAMRFLLSSENPS